MEKSKYELPRYPSCATNNTVKGKKSNATTCGQLPCPNWNRGIKATVHCTLCNVGVFCTETCRQEHIKQGTCNMIVEVNKKVEANRKRILAITLEDISKERKSKF